MTIIEKQTIVSALSVAVRVAEAIETKEVMKDGLPEIPNIGAAFSNVNIAERLIALPFDEQEVLDVMQQVNEAIQSQSRVAGALDNTTTVLASIRSMLPMLLGL